MSEGINIRLRQAPAANAPLVQTRSQGNTALAEVATSLQEGEQFNVTEVQEVAGARADGGDQVFLRLAGSRGWAFAFHPRTGERVCSLVEVPKTFCQSHPKTGSVSPVSAATPRKFKRAANAAVLQATSAAAAVGSDAGPHASVSANTAVSDDVSDNSAERAISKADKSDCGVSRDVVPTSTTESGGTNIHTAALHTDRPVAPSWTKGMWQHQVVGAGSTMMRSASVPDLPPGAEGVPHRLRWAFALNMPDAKPSDLKIGFDVRFEPSLRTAETDKIARVLVPSAMLQVPCFPEHLEGIIPLPPTAGRVSVTWTNPSSWLWQSTRLVTFALTLEGVSSSNVKDPDCSINPFASETPAPASAHMPDSSSKTNADPAHKPGADFQPDSSQPGAASSSAGGL